MQDGAGDFERTIDHGRTHTFSEPRVDQRAQRIVVHLTDFKIAGVAQSICTCQAMLTALRLRFDSSRNRFAQSERVGRMW